MKYTPTHSALLDPRQAEDFIGASEHVQKRKRDRKNHYQQTKQIIMRNNKQNIQIHIAGPHHSLLKLVDMLDLLVNFVRLHAVIWDQSVLASLV